MACIKQRIFILEISMYIQFEKIISFGRGGFKIEDL